MSWCTWRRHPRPRLRTGSWRARTSLRHIVKKNGPRPPTQTDKVSALVRVDVGAGDLEYDPSSDLHGMIGKPFVVPTQQRDVDGSSDRERPSVIQQHAEEVAVQDIHSVVVFGQLSCLIGISGQHNIFDISADVHGDAGHLREVAVQILGDSMCRVSAPGGFRHMQRKNAHALEVGDVLQTADNHSEITGNRRLQGKQRERIGFSLYFTNHEILVATDHGFSRDDVRVEQGPGRPLHRRPRQIAHVGDALSQRIELVVKRRAHTSTVLTQRT